MANGHGGKREGAGPPTKPEGLRKQLPKPGKTKAPAELEDATANLAVASSRRQTPLAFLLAVMRSEDAPFPDRLLCAREALKYCHAERKHTDPKARKEPPLGKKAQRQERAHRAALTGKYAVPSGPSVQPYDRQPMLVRPPFGLGED